MKLNNKGWGFRAMFFLMSILVAFFMVAIYMVYRYYDTIEQTARITGSYVRVVK